MGTPGPKIGGGGGGGGDPYACDTGLPPFSMRVVSYSANCKGYTLSSENWSVQKLVRADGHFSLAKIGPIPFPFRPGVYSDAVSV